VRLALYIDALYREENGRVLTSTETLPFLCFGCEVGRHFDELVLLGRAAPEGAGADRPLPRGPVLSPLPWYPSLAALAAVTRAVFATLPALWRVAARADIVWAFGPHPFSLVLALMALARRRRVVLGVRQDTLRYFRSRMRSRRQRVLAGPLWVLEAAWRALSHVVPVTVVGSALERRYAGPRPGVLPMTISLVRSADVAPAPAPPPSGDGVRLLTVGRVDREKNPLLLVEALAALMKADPDRRWRLRYAGTGPLVEAVQERARELGVFDALELSGFVAPGEDLHAMYRSADLFVHVAWTEGVPQVLVEAFAAGLPVVATAVGGVPAALENGDAGVLVPPGDRDALVSAILATLDDPDARDRRARRGLEIAQERALDREAARVAGWLTARAVGGRAR
jgi:glycosyltransferase involved in cell wall biosynthesis